MSESKMIFSKNLKLLLDRNNISQVELSKILGVSESSVGKWLLQKSMQFRESVLGTGSVLIKHCWNGWRRYVSRGAYQLRHRLRDSQH